MLLIRKPFVVVMMMWVMGDGCWVMGVVVGMMVSMRMIVLMVMMGVRVGGGTVLMADR